MFYKNKITVAMLLTLSTLTVGCGGGGGGDDESQPKDNTPIVTPSTPDEVTSPITEDSSESDTDSVEKPADDTNTVTPEPNPEPTPDPEDPYTPPAGYIPEDPTPLPNSGEYTLPTYVYVGTPADALTNLYYVPEVDLTKTNKIGEHSTHPTLISDLEPYTTTECRLNDLINCADLNGNDYTIPYYTNKHSLEDNYLKDTKDIGLIQNYFTDTGHTFSRKIAQNNPDFIAYYDNNGNVITPPNVPLDNTFITYRWDLDNPIPLKIDGTDPTGTKRIQYAIELMEKTIGKKVFDLESIKNTPNENIDRGIIIKFDSAWNWQTFDHEELYYDDDKNIKVRPLKKCAIASRFDNQPDAYNNQLKYVNGVGVDENGVDIKQSNGWKPEFPQTYFNTTPQTIDGKVYLNIDYTTHNDLTNVTSSCFANRDMIFSELAVILGGGRNDYLAKTVNGTQTTTIKTDKNGTTDRFFLKNNNRYYNLGTLIGLHTKYNTTEFPSKNVITTIMQNPPHNFPEVYGNP
ncbi:hypothetical protein [Photobacterium leiognathi]|uniref:Uncharacterized protein n=1 Tax=Photobacterium leiognathi TaxID=553611 RepID=A0ABX5GCW4_PHOLE|nr:hypothetical protein [Photobacterium leiognathi]KJF89142.1 hypothetical protein UB42_14940 [Photobacterium leiognathi]PSV79537.1 hypothetical protein CTM94_15775 [Photobacterium leiognathi]